jgi:hypothetical protein
MRTGEWHKLCACVPGWATLQRREALHDESEREEASGTAIDRAAVGDDPNTARHACPASHRRTSSCHDDQLGLTNNNKINEKTPTHASTLLALTVTVTVLL